MYSDGVLVYRGPTDSYLQKSDGAQNPLEFIWDGYAQFDGCEVVVQQLSKSDYQHGKPMIMLAPVDPVGHEGAIEFYFNERLPDSLLSLFGHFSVAAAGRVFNFSRVFCENEVLSVAEYFYRPALGEYAPAGSPATLEGQYPGYGYYGRRFMRGIYVLRVEGLDLEPFVSFLEETHQQWRNCTPDTRNPEVTPCFNLLFRNCATIVRAGLDALGVGRVRGVLPRDFFTALCAYFFKLQKKKPNSLCVSCCYLPQLPAVGVPRAKHVPLLNPLNWLKWSFVKPNLVTMSGFSSLKM